MYIKHTSEIEAVFSREVCARNKHQVNITLCAVHVNMHWVNITLCAVRVTCTGTILQYASFFAFLSREILAIKGIREFQENQGSPENQETRYVQRNSIPRTDTQILGFRKSDVFLCFTLFCLFDRG